MGRPTWFLPGILGITLFGPYAVLGAPSGASIAAQGSGSAPPCAVCHGAHGEGNPAIGAPRLVGVGAAYLQEQLRDFADGTRASPIMAPTAKALGSAQGEAVAAYYAGLPAPAIAAAAGGVSPGKLLAERGRWSDGLPACSQCHGPEGVGVGAAFPPLAGLPASYVTAQLQAWQEGHRAPGPLGLMAAVAKKMSKTDIEDVAAYFASIGRTSTPEAGK